MKAIWVNAVLYINLGLCWLKYRQTAQQNKKEILETEPLTNTTLWSVVRLQSNGGKRVFSMILNDLGPLGHLNVYLRKVSVTHTQMSIKTNFRWIEQI